MGGIIIAYFFYMKKVWPISLLSLILVFLLSTCGGGGGDSSSPAPAAEFSASPTIGPAPLIVSFTDQSTGGATSWSWDFGDGGTSTLQDPSHNYVTSGTYTVSLTVTGTGGSESVTKVDYITVTPLAEFSASLTTGNAPLTVQFFDESTGGATSWSWDFGDGGTSMAKNPSHSYVTSGTYTVLLTATGAGGPNTKTRLNYITVGTPPPAPTAEFSASRTTGNAPLTVQFFEESTGGATSWSWDFGDGGTSMAKNTLHSYVTSGIYTVSLTVTGPGGSNTVTKVDYITVTLLAGFSASPTTGTAPLDVQFTDESTGGATSWSWDFGDGGTSIAKNPSHSYVTSGIYTVSLTVTGPGGSNTVTKVDYINITTLAGFSASPATGTAPLDVQFTDESAGVISTWSWDFGDNTTSPAQHPLHTYTVDGTYTVSLTVTGPGGSDTITKPAYITVEALPPAPVADFSASLTTGPAPLDVQFTDQSTGSPTSWSWDFGDGGTSTLQDPLHTYTAAGSYDVSLTVTGPGGSDSVTKVDYIIVDPPVFTDDFNRADVDPIGAPWVTSPGQGDVAILNSELKGSVEGVPGGGAYYNGSFANNQYSQATIAVMSNVGVTVRMSATEQSCYRFQVVSATNALLDKYVNGIYSQLDNVVGTFAAGDIIRLEVSGSTLTAIQNGSTIATANDNSLTGGFPGVRFFNAIGARLDDWEGGSLP
jgi:PKD repeat protein